ncbi:hypothetical protein RHMOL_Rhmol08G0137400 [Rhododendron molle]|uniref:Uncharacterized protein n=1 Tax=Rhododendron molle TaxID=49168 RepID=A0ACC0MNT8_RHOML|nr:hypothetical protein RHMOL_Rhmol08G0137400 [Rhododendron molle]
MPNVFSILGLWQPTNDYVFIRDEDLGIKHFDPEEFVEIMRPVFSRDAWHCVWHMIQVQNIIFMFSYCSPPFKL